MKFLLLPALLLCSIFTFGQFQIFSVPGAGVGDQQGTYPQAINSKGFVAGFYVDASNTAHGFSRTKQGDLTIINGFNSKGGSTSVTAVNSIGQVVGEFVPGAQIQNAQSVGFLLSPGGKYVAIQAASGQTATRPFAVNDSGVVTGIWTDFSGSGYHGFVRDATGKISTFDGNSQSVNTIALGINASNQVVGYYSDDFDNNTHSFVRDSEGNITSFDPDGSTGTFATSVNTAGQIAGYYFDSENHPHGFIRNSDGSFTTFTVPGANSLSGQGATHQISLNDAGQTAGQALLGNSSIIAWIRRASGTILEFQVCGQSGIAGMNNLGHVTGFCGDTAQELSFEGFTF